MFHLVLAIDTATTYVWGFAQTTHCRIPCFLPPPYSLDTGRLNPETYQLFDAVEKHYNIHIEYTFPDAQETMELVRTKGMFSFYEDGHQECCRVRKVRGTRGVCVNVLRKGE